MAVYNASSYLKKLAYERDKQKNELLYQSQARQMAAKQGVSAAMDSVAKNSAANTNYRRGTGVYAGDGAGARQQGGANTVRVKVGSDALQELEQANLDKLRTQQVDADYQYKTGRLRDAAYGSESSAALRRQVGQTWDENTMSWNGAVNMAKLRKARRNR